MGVEFNLDDLFEEFEDETEELYKKRTERYAQSKLELNKEKEELSDLDLLFADLENDPGIKFKQTVLDLAQDCSKLSTRYVMTNYDNILNLKVRRLFRGKKIYDTLQLRSEYGDMVQMTFANLTFEKEDSDRIFRGVPVYLPTKRGNFVIARGRVNYIIHEMLDLARQKSGDGSFRINETNYFSFLQTQERRPFLIGTYYCSKKKEFVFD